MISSSILYREKSVKTAISARGPAQKNFYLKINTDSRTFKKGETFIAMVGDNFDGFNYLEHVLESGARAVIFNSSEEREKLLPFWAEFYPQVLFVTVEDTLLFIQNLARAHLLAWKENNPRKKVIALTGSNGKTTHKEMLYFLLNSLYPGKVLATAGNLNNHIGVPLTLFRLEKKHRLAIIEMGMNHAGEIKILCDIAMPEHGIITNIGAAHIEFLKSMENIFKEKKVLYDTVFKNTNGHGVFVVNADDKYLQTLKKTKGLVTYGEKNGDVRIEIDGNKIAIHIENKLILITNKNIHESYNLKNLAGVVVFSMKLFPHLKEEIKKAAEKYRQPSMNRSQWEGGIFLDAYNANPSSMRTSLDSFVQTMKARKIPMDECYFVLGDMNELGEHALKMHQEIATHIKELGIKNVSFIGKYREFYLKGFETPTSHYLTKEEFFPEWKLIRKNFKYVFIKASRSLQLESLMTIV